MLRSLATIKRRGPAYVPGGPCPRKNHALLTAAGWTIQDYKQLNLAAASGIALREVSLKSGPCDYLLLVDRVPVGVIEAKKAGTTLSGVIEQSASYAESLPDFLADRLPVAKSLPFTYESTGVETLFCDARDSDARSRRVFSFHRPETLTDWLANRPPLRARLKAFPPLPTEGMRTCQVEASTHLEAFGEALPTLLAELNRQPAA